MSRRKQNSSVKKKPAAKASSTSIAPANPNSQHAKADLKRTKYLKDLKSAQRSLERFETKDLIQFEQWRSEVFGERISELHGLSETLDDLMELIEEVEDQRTMSGYTFRESYEIVKERRENPGGIEDEEAFYHDDFEEPSPKQAQEDPQAFYDHMRKEFAELFGFDLSESDPAFDEQFKQFASAAGFPDLSSNGATSAKRPPDKKELKKVYRGLARRLHPDHREGIDTLSPARLDELWHSAQKSYAEGDLEELHHIETQIDIEVNGVTEEINLDRIEQMSERNRVSLRAVQRELRQARKHVAWMFSKKPSAKVELERFFDADIEFEKSALEKDIAICNRRIAEWERPARKKTKKASSKNKSTTRKKPKPPKIAKTTSQEEDIPDDSQCEFTF